MVKGVIFDMDGLMFDTERLWDTLWEPACAALGLPLPADMEKFRAGGRGLAGDNLRRHVAEYIPGDPQKVLDKIWQLGDERFARGVPCKKGLKELLAALEDMGLPRIVASSSPRNMIEMNLQTTGTARYFHDVVSGTEVAHSKPAPDTFLVAAKKLHLDPHDCLVLDGEPCTCGRRGCWEAYSSATALIRQARQAAAEHPESLLAGAEEITGKTVFDAADRGDETANAVVDRFCDYLGAGVTNIVNALAPEVILIGGGISRQGERLLAPVRRYVEKNCFGGKDGAIPIIAAARLGNDAGIIGAAAL